jgi:hypothetical protein
MPNIVPLTLHEQSIRQTKSTSFRSKHDSTKAPNDTKSNKKSSKKQNSASISKSSSRKSKDNPSKPEGKVFFEGGGQYEEEQEGNNDEHNTKSDDPLEGFDFYPSARMDFEVFEIELFVKPKFKALNSQVWSDMM